MVASRGFAGVLMGRILMGLGVGCGFARVAQLCAECVLDEAEDT